MTLNALHKFVVNKNVQIKLGLKPKFALKFVFNNSVVVEEPGLNLSLRSNFSVTLLFGLN